MMFIIPRTEHGTSFSEPRFFVDHILWKFGQYPGANTASFVGVLGGFDLTALDSSADRVPVNF